jgi:hypothetical protein
MWRGSRGPLPQLFWGQTHSFFSGYSSILIIKHLALVVLNIIQVGWFLSLSTKSFFSLKGKTSRKIKSEGKVKVSG